MALNELAWLVANLYTPLDVNADQGPISQALILAKYDPGQWYNQLGIPGCMLEARWP